MDVDAQFVGTIKLVYFLSFGLFVVNGPSKCLKVNEIILNFDFFFF